MVESKPSQQKFSLGNTSLGETLDDFQSQFPKAVCGSSLYAAEVALADEADKIGLTGCCLDRPMYVWKFSSHRILPAASCHILATFYHSELIALRYVIDVRNIDNLLLEFTQLYGSATFDGLLKSQNPQRVAAWVLVQLWKTASSKPIQDR